MIIFPLNDKKRPTCNEWQSYKGACTSPMYGIKVPYGFMVIDLDTYKDVTRQDVENVLGGPLDWDDAYSQKTLNGGEHYIFAVPENSKIKQGSDLFKLKGFDTRAAEKGYVATGAGYTTVDGDKLEDHFDDFKPALSDAALEILTACNNNALIVNDDIDALDLTIKRDKMAVCNPDGSFLDPKQIKAILTKLPKEVGADNESWIKVCAGLKRQLLGSGVAIEKLNDRGSWGYIVLNAWSESREGYDSEAEKANFQRWKSFKADDTGELITFASVVGMAGGLPTIKVNEATGEKVVSDTNFINDYVMNALGKYVSKVNKVEYSKATFDTKHGKDTPINSRGNHFKPSTVAEGVIDIVAEKMYAPNFNLLFNHGGVDYLNTYQEELHAEVTPEEVEAAKALLSGHIKHLVEDPREASMIINYLAYCVQNIGEKLQWSIILQGVQGDGKSFFSEMMRSVLGLNNVRVMNAQTLESNFTGWSAGQCMTFIEELKLDNFKKYEISNKIKPFISNPTVEQVKKGRDPVTVPNTTNYFAFSNYKDCFPIDDNDRRWGIIFSRWQSGPLLEKFISDNPTYYDNLYTKMRASIPALFKVLSTHKIDKWFTDLKRAPQTASRMQMIKLSKSPCKMALEDALEEFPEVINGDILNISELNRKVKMISDMGDDVRFEDFPNSRAIKTILSGLGFYYFDRKKMGGNVCTLYKKS